MDENARREKIGLGVGVAGAAIATTGFLLSKKIPPIHELRKIAGDHNRPLQVAPIVTGTSGGVVVTGTF